MKSTSAIALFFALTLPARGAEPVDYLRQVKPLLATKCFACHGALRHESDLRLDTAALIRQGGAGGPAIVAGNADDSRLVDKVAAADPAERMPPAGEGEPLTPSQIEVLRAWIAQGAVAPDEPIPPDPRQHWAWQPVIRPAIPPFNRDPTGSASPVALSNVEALPVGSRLNENAIDALLGATYSAAGLQSAGPASKETLLRRVYLDLVGLPPTREELHAFLADESPQAYENVVERLLASPQYGERWGRHWMDVWRYSDWTGFGNEIRYSQRHVWRWRDWIVASLNADRGYDRMILEMLAADELAPGDEAAAPATGFLARNWYKFDRNTWLDDVVDHTSKAFLGMTLKCARCHDHKYDPLSQREYYAFRAVFEPYEVRTDPAPGGLDLEKNGAAAIYDAHPETPTYLFLRGDPKRPEQDRPVAPGTPAVVAGPEFAVAPVTLPPLRKYPFLRPFVAEEMLADARSKAAAAEAEVEAARAQAVAAPALSAAEKKQATAEANLAAVEARIAAEQAKYAGELHAAAPNPDELGTLAKAAGRAERLAAAADSDEKLLLAQQELERARAAPADNDAAKQALTALEEKVKTAEKTRDDARLAAGQGTESYQPLGPSYPATSTGRRSALARWIADRRNPLTARVAVNHIWLRHFGQPLVESVDDFGLRAPQPALASVLDYLAAELMDRDWSMKHVHRLIVTSEAYRRASHDDRPELSAANAARDPDNKLLWRMNVRRMDAEAVRDALLFASGDLDLKQGGPDLEPGEGLTSPRRSFYFRHARERQVEFLQIFDAANPEECYRRRDSIRPQQVFALVNSSLAIQQSQRLAERLTAAGEDRSDAAFVAALFETILGRRPSEAESNDCVEFLVSQTSALGDPEKLDAIGEGDATSFDPALRARGNLALVLFNHNDFVTIR